MRNLKEGRNPFTGKEFYVFHCHKNGVEKLGSWQTRYGAEKARKESGKKRTMIIEEGKMFDKLNKWEGFRKAVPAIIRKKREKCADMLSSASGASDEVKRDIERRFDKAISEIRMRAEDQLDWYEGFLSSNYKLKPLVDFKKKMSKKKSA